MNLQELSDRIEIDDLLTRYATGLDRRDWELWQGCFTADAQIDYSAFGGAAGGVQEVRSWLERTFAGFGPSQHLVTNREVRLDGDRATARSGFFNPMSLPAAGGGFAVFFCGGYYCDELVRTPQGWRIARRVEEYSYSTLRQPLWRASVAGGGAPNAE